MANIKGKQLVGNLAVTNVTASGHISGSNTSTGSFGLLQGDGSELTGITSGIFQPTSSVQATTNDLQITGSLTTSGSLTTIGDVNVSQFIYHIDDSNTYLNFTEDRLRFNIGGISYIDLNDVGSAPHDITFNDGGNNVDLNIKGSSNNPLFKTDASTNRIGTHGKGSPEVAFHIGGSELRVDGNISGSAAGTGSFGKVVIGEMSNQDVTSVSSSISTRLTTAETELGNTLFSGSVQVDHDATTNFVANEHIDHSAVSISAGGILSGGGDITTNRTITLASSDVVHDSTSGFVANEHIDHSGVTLTAGDGLSGGGDITTNRTFAVDSSVLRTTSGVISSSAQISSFSSSAQVDHDSTTNFVANEHIDHSSVSVIAGTGMTGGGTIASNRTLNVVGGTGVTANADDIAIGQDVSTTSNVLFANITGSNISGSSLLGVVGTATQGTIDIHSLSGYVANENIDHSGVTITAGDGLTGGGTIESTRTLTVGAGTGITVNSSDVATDDSAIVHDDLSGFVANEHIDHTSVTLTAGAGLTGGGTIASNRTFAVGAGTGITVNANDVAIGQSVATNANVNFATITTTGNITAQGDIIAENYIVSSSVTHLTSSAISGSSIFGDTQDDTHQFTGSVFVTGSTFNIDSIGSVSSSNSGSFLNVKAANNVNATNIYGTLSTATQGTIDHDSLANFVADEHVAHGGVSVIAGDGLTGGGTIASNRTINVVGGDGITANANDVAITAAQTTITSIFAEDLKIGEDDQTKIDFETANQINFYGDNVKLLELSNANTGDAVFNVATADKNFTITGTDGSTAITALDIDMAAAGNAQFSGNISGSQIEASGDVIAFGSSDRRLKDNITPIENPLEKMDKIGGYTFDWNEKQDAYKGHDVGVIAQEIEEILPELVTTRGTGYKAVKYEKIVPLLIESIKELQKKVQKIEENCDCLNK